MLPDGKLFRINMKQDFLSPVSNNRWPRVKFQKDVGFILPLDLKEEFFKRLGKCLINYCLDFNLVENLGHM